jgi:hypothetical protein
MGSDLIGPIGPILGAGIAAIVGILYSIQIDAKKRKQRLKVVSNAIILEIEKFKDFFEYFLKYIGASEGPQNTGTYFEVTMQWIVKYGIAIPGPNSALLSEQSPFSMFYSDIFNFNDSDRVRNIKDFYECVLNFDKSFKNFSQKTRSIDDLRNMKIQAERGLDIIENGELIEYLVGFL